jgi:hypothetical protein
MDRRAGPRRAARALAAALGLLPLVACAGSASGEILFRPLVADPRESVSRWRQSSYVADWRYGADVTDSTSRGGVVEDRRGVQWELAAGNVFRWRVLERLFGARPPWVGYQLGAPAAIFADFENDGSLLNTDWQFGGSFEVQWTGARGGERPFARPVTTSRLSLMHRSSHLGDEYLALGAIGRNQDGHPLQGALFDRPPVKRVDLSYESIQAIVAVEWAPRGARGASTVRAYAGGDAKLVLPARWQVGALRPRDFHTPAARGGLEWRSAGNGAAPAEGVLARAVNRVAGTALVGSEWFAALDVRLAKPFEFSTCDDPTGFGEVWTPRLWTECPYGRERRGFAGTWRGMLGATLRPATGRGPEWTLALEWYRGHSTSGQFLDQRLRYRPRGWVLPSVTARF